MEIERQRDRELLPSALNGGLNSHLSPPMQINSGNFRGTLFLKFTYLLGPRCHRFELLSRIPLFWIAPRGKAVLQGLPDNFHNFSLRE